MKHAQLLELGLGRHAIGRWVRTGRLHRRYPGVYAVGHPLISSTGELTAALFFAGQGAALSHGSAAHWWGLVREQPPEIHISVRGRRRPVDGIVLHHPRRLDRTFHHRLPVTPVPRTLLDFASTASVNDIRKALAEADFRNRLDLPALKAVMGKGLPGSATLRAAVEAHMPELAHTLSPMEDEFLLLCERHGFPIPHPNYWIGERCVDAFWPEFGIVVELDSKAAHSSEARRLIDHRRDAELRALGYAVRRFSWFQVYFEPDVIVADLERTMAKRRRELLSSAPAWRE